MDNELRTKLQEFIELAKIKLPVTTVGVNIFFNASSVDIHIDDRTSEQLKSEGISMRNIQGDFIE